MLVLVPLDRSRSFIASDTMAVFCPDPPSDLIEWIVLLHGDSADAEVFGSANQSTTTTIPAHECVTSGALQP